MRDLGGNIHARISELIRQGVLKKLQCITTQNFSQFLLQNSTLTIFSTFSSWINYIGFFKDFDSVFSLAFSTFSKFHQNWSVTSYLWNLDFLQYLKALNPLLHSNREFWCLSLALFSLWASKIAKGTYLVVRLLSLIQNKSLF